MIGLVEAVLGLTLFLPDNESAHSSLYANFVSHSSLSSGCFKANGLISGKDVQIGERTTRVVLYSIELLQMPHIICVIERSGDMKKGQESRRAE